MYDDDILDGCWIDVNGFTKKDWEIIESLASTLKGEGYFKSNDFKCCVAALALFVDSGKGIRESDH